MNFLGHLLVSGNDPMTIVGNFMADGVKGRDLSAYAEGLQKGIRMHRHIDSYTDGHPLTLQGRERLRAHCGKYAGVALDLFYDHAIAHRWNELSREPLPEFTQRIYALLTGHEALMPERVRNMLPYMVQQDWLNSYATIAGIGRALLGLSRRTPAGPLLAGAEQVLQDHHAEFERECLEFIPQLRSHLASENA
jgi:acyl carrier protein phosphodiesterase